jgi:DNA-binding response OmpR family regulator
MNESITDIERILAVDDNPYTLRIVEVALSKAGYEVVTATSGQEALNLIQRTGIPHLAIVDLNMPGMNGFQFCKAVHQFSDLPIVMLTAVDEESTIVRGIEEFAEDYMVKPFSTGELVARVRRVLRRIGTYAYTLDPVIAVDEWLQVDFPGRRAIVDGKNTSLTPTESRLLYLLMRSAGRVVSTDFLLRRLWPLEEAYEDRLHVHVHRLRRKIEKNHKEPTYVVSERGLGYIFPARLPAVDRLAGRAEPAAQNQ